MKSIVVFSGGLDSTTMLYDCVNRNGADNVIALTFKYGQKHSFEIEKAIATTKKLHVPHNVVDVSFLGHMVSSVCSLTKESSIDIPSITEVLGDPAPSTEVPFRNLIFFSIALSLAQTTDCTTIWCGIQAHDLYGYFDATPAFVDAVNAVASLNRKHQIKIKSPYALLSKAEEIAIGDQLEVPYEDTWSCYEGPDSEGRACGKCATCAERINAFARVGRPDPVKYAMKLDWERLIVRRL